MEFKRQADGSRPLAPPSVHFSLMNVCSCCCSLVLVPRASRPRRREKCEVKWRRAAALLIPVEHATPPVTVWVLVKWSRDTHGRFEREFAYTRALQPKDGLEDVILGPTVPTHELHFLTNTRGWKDQDEEHRNKRWDNDATVETRVEDEDAAASHATAGDMSAVDISNSAPDVHGRVTLEGEGKSAGTLSLLVDSSMEQEAEALQLSDDDGRCDGHAAITASHAQEALGRAGGADCVAAAGSIATAAAEMYRGQLEAISSSRLPVPLGFSRQYFSHFCIVNLRCSGQS